MKLKTLTITELRAKKPADIEKYVAELQNSFTELSHQISINKDNKTHQLGQIKKSIAKAKTIQAQNAVAAAKSGEEK